MKMSNIGLEGIKVVDLTAYVAGPACPRILGEMGATVYKIEPFTGDEQRTQGASWGMNHKTKFDDAAFDMSSMNKKWLSINLKSPEGQALIYKLIGDADIVITSFRDGALKRLGLDYETLSGKFPHIVWGQMRGYGERGPERDAKGFDATSYSARGGLVMSFPQANEHFEPGNAPIAIGDWNACVALTAGVLAALVRRLRSGKGDKVVVNLYHCAVWAMTSAVVARQQGAEYPKDRKNAPCPTNNSYKSRDGIWFIICFGNYNKYFELVMTTMGLDHLVGNKDYDTLEVIGETGAYRQVIKWMEEAFAQQDFAYWETLFKERDIPFQKCFTVDDILEDQEAFDNDILRKIHYDALGEYTVTTTPIRIKSVGDPVLYRSRPIGYDTREVMREYGYSNEQIDAMTTDGQVLCYSEEPAPESVLNPSFGIDSIKR
ncbi:MULTISPECIES: CaiB/BaiF CoA-transferase family protein [unclassified Brenneria]|uniref:CaiB/BaiF CoA transferase family protein n=1 Tax=unclassified Brenneria TaxID=2634434 RepID=UPI0029C144AF|nr:MULTISPECIES: CaiB/BaiF CoA-transferase family protein [unclassified Brenneria]MDX5628775.1 CaiB/BaiF CoA-transferase family protein [Brenneria sp. L3-3Z]MDX5695914.1 CaiB/BaiF CoA-transferase family protein [Brenneria sp. L4-2C]